MVDNWQAESHERELEARGPGREQRRPAALLAAQESRRVRRGGGA